MYFDSYFKFFMSAIGNNYLLMNDDALPDLTALVTDYLEGE